MTAHCERTLQSTWAFTFKAGQLPPLCDPAGLQAFEFSPLSCYFPLCLSLKRDDPKHLLSILLLLSLSGKGAWILFPGKTILTSYHFAEQQTTPHLQGPGRCRRALPQSTGPAWDGHVWDFLTDLRGFNSAPWLVCARLILDHSLTSCCGLRSNKVVVPCAASDYPSEKTDFS